MQEQEDERFKNREFTEDEHKLSGIIHDFALNIISQYTVEDLQKLVNSGMVPNLRIYKKVVPYNLRLKVYEKWIENKEQIKAFFCYEELLFQAEDHHPEFVPVITSEQGERFFKAFINLFERVIIEDFGD